MNEGLALGWQYPSRRAGKDAVSYPELEALCGEHVNLEFDDRRAALWFWFHPTPVPCFNPGILKELLAVQAALMESNCRVAFDRHRVVDLRWVLLASAVPGVFNLGGDLALFLELIEAQDRARLFKYATDCVDTIFAHVQGYGPRVGTISLVQGRALGGGLECALASGTIIAEEQAVFALPEILFNLFPGMGAMNMLARRVSGARTDVLITSGGQWTAKQMFEWGVVSEVVANDHGVSAANAFMDKFEKGGALLQRIKRIHDPISREELIQSIEAWTSAAMGISNRDLRLIRRLRHAQGSLGLGADRNSDISDRIRLA